MQTEITELLLKVGIMPNKQGFKFLLYAIEAYIEEYSTLKKIYERISPAVKSNVYTIDSSTINRHRDFSFFLDSGAAFIVTPLL